MLWNISGSASMLIEYMLSMNCDWTQKRKRYWRKNPEKLSLIILPGPMWICCLLSLKKMNDRRPAGRRPSFAYSQRFTIAQPQKFLCYPEQLCSPRFGAGASTNAKNHPLSKMENRWFCQSGYHVALLARLLLRSRQETFFAFAEPLNQPVAAVDIFTLCKLCGS